MIIEIENKNFVIFLIISFLMQMNQSFSFFSSSKLIHTTKIQQFISLKQTSHYTLFKFLSSYFAINSSYSMIFSFLASSTHLIEYILLKKSKNFFFDQKLIMSISLIISYEREQQSQRSSIISRKRISNCLINKKVI